MFKDNLRINVGKTFHCRPVRGMYGIEIETEGANLPAGPVTRAFQGKLDGSLRQGMEYVSIPLMGNVVGAEVNKLREEILRQGAKIIPSYRCSTHIHQNYTDKSFREVLGMSILWALIEPVVMRLMPPGRDGSLFCVSTYDSGELADFTENFCKAIDDRMVNGFHPRGKYSSLNFSRLGPSEHNALGTLEFRVFPTSLEGEQVQMWCDWLTRALDLVVRAQDDSYISMVRHAEQNPLPFLESIFGHVPLPKAEAGDYVDYGARTAYEMARVVAKFLNTKPKQEKKKGFGVMGDIIPNDPGIPEEVMAALHRAEIQQRMERMARGANRNQPVQAR